MIKLILSDMDDTLIPIGRPHATQRTLDAIHACQAEGLLFAPASGRIRNEVAQFLSFDEPTYATAVLANGHQVYIDGQLVSETTLCSAALERAYQLIANLPRSAVLVYRPDGVCDWVGASYERLMPLIARVTLGGYHHCTQLPDYPIVKAGILAYVDPAHQLALQQQLTVTCPELDFLNTAPGWFNVVARGWSKVDGIKVLERELSIPNHQICVFGDAENDLAMFAHVTHSCAVANATPGVRAAARWQVGATTDDGVAIALEQLADAARRQRQTDRDHVPAFMRQDCE